MAIVSKIIPPITLEPMLNVVFNPPGTQQRFYAYTALSPGPQIKRGESELDDYYDVASAITGGASVALTKNVVISVSENSTGEKAISEIRAANSGDNTSILYYITISPAEEFLYAGTITITTATITISNTMT